MQVIYDIMVCAVGEQTATFGVPGVMEHCYFMKVCSHHMRTPPKCHIFTCRPLPTLTEVCTLSCELSMLLHAYFASLF